MSEIDYRRGYAHGANEVLDAIMRVLSAQDNQTLTDWFNNDILPWRNGQPDGFIPSENHKHPPVL